MTPTTTKSGTRQGAALLTTGPGKAQQHIPHTCKEYKDMTQPTEPTFEPNDRFRILPLGDRYDNVEGTIRSVVTAADGEQYAHTRHDDGTLTMWQLSRLERVERELPPLPQRIRGATLTDSYVDAGDEPEDPRDAVRGTVGEVSALDLWEAARGHLALFGGLDPDADRRSFAAAMRDVADVLDGGAK